MERSDLFTKLSFQSFYNAHVISIGIIHSGYVDDSRNLIFLTESPCFVSTNFDTGLCIDNDDCSISNA